MGKASKRYGASATFQSEISGVGNEQWEPQYIERYKVFEKAILSKYPEIKLYQVQVHMPKGNILIMHGKN